MGTMPNGAAAPHPRRALFVLVVLVGSFLLFLIQPLIARFALPLLGGAPNVWNSAMLVFQLLLLGGYLYAHALSHLPLRRQAVIHLALMGAAAFTLPIALVGLPAPAPGWEVLWVPALFALTIGPVFFVISAQASLMQRWFAAAPGAGNPYALYAASNLGSFAGLLTYPLWLEPRMALGQQSDIWTAGYLVLLALVALAALARWNAPAPDTLPAEESPAAAPPGTGRIALWLALAAVPSGLIISTTTLLTTDIMAMPLLWVVPLGVYLLSFTIAFSDSGDWSGILSRYAPGLLLLGGSLGMVSGGRSNPAVALVMVALLFVLAVALHGRLYALRPATRHLTLFYLALAAGGAIGGVFAALVAPVVFDWVYEHPLLLLAAAVLLPEKPLFGWLGRFWREGRRRHLVAAFLIALAAALAWRLSSAVEAGEGELSLILVPLIAALGIAAIGMRPAFVAIFALLMLGHGGLTTLETSAKGERTRSYFGIYGIERSEDGTRRQLSHGTTVHGSQWLDPARRNDPTSYYGPTGGVGIALQEAAGDARIGIVGLGVGTLACYRQPRQAWTFYEIDPQILTYSQRGIFTFLADCTPDARIVLGDARLELAKEPAAHFDLLAIDAFSSDSIPMHLLTAEAFANYGRTLAPDGLLLVHISNRYIDLAPMISAQARETGWHGRMRRDLGEIGDGLSPSIWIALARDEGRLARLEGSRELPWDPLPAPARHAWTDDNASILPLIRW